MCRCLRLTSVTGTAHKRTHDDREPAQHLPRACRPGLRRGRQRTTVPERAPTRRGTQGRRRHPVQQHLQARRPRPVGHRRGAPPARSRPGSSAPPAPLASCPSSCTSTVPAGYSGTPTRTTGSCGTSPSALMPRSCSPSTASPPRPTSRSRSSSPTPSRAGSSPRVHRTTARRLPPGGRRRLRRREHGRGAHPPGQAARRCARSRPQVLFYPVTNASFDTASYHHFADGYHLTPRRPCCGSGTSTRPTRTSAPTPPPPRCARPPENLTGAATRRS